MISDPLDSCRQRFQQIGNVRLRSIKKHTLREAHPIGKGYGFGRCECNQTFSGLSFKGWRSSESLCFNSLAEKGVFSQNFSTFLAFFKRPRGEKGPPDTHISCLMDSFLSILAKSLFRLVFLHHEGEFWETSRMPAGQTGIWFHRGGKFMQNAWICQEFLRFFAAVNQPPKGHETLSEHELEKLAAAGRGCGNFHDRG